MKTEVQRVLRAMSPAQKLRPAERLYWSARQLKAAALRAKHPDWTEEAIEQAVRELSEHRGKGLELDSTGYNGRRLRASSAARHTLGGFAQHPQA